MSLNKAVFSSISVEWRTPQWIFDYYNDMYYFDIDLCATYANRMCDQYFSIEDDALTKTWRGKCWLNPPYGRSISKWVKKAYESSKKGALIVCLLPARTDTIWFHEYCIKGEIDFIKGRLRFNNSDSNAPFPSCVVTFRPDKLGVLS